MAPFCGNKAPVTISPPPAKQYTFCGVSTVIYAYNSVVFVIGRPFLNTTAPTAEPEPEYYLGDLITGTYCSRIFSDCDRKHCRLQSPNFPGVYPRNLTCYYAVRQHEIPPGKHALIVVRQLKGQLVSIRSQAALYGTASTRELKVWNDCDDVQDYVTVYDGYTTRDPVILKFCGGGEAVPEAVSSGHELLVEFSTSPYGTFLYPSPSQALHGFQLEVEVCRAHRQNLLTKRSLAGQVRRSAVAELRQGEAPMRVLPEGDQQGGPREPVAFPAGQHDLSLPPPGHRHVRLALSHPLPTSVVEVSRLEARRHDLAASQVPRLALHRQIPRRRLQGPAKTSTWRCVGAT
jgi:hypothetical protein